MPRNKTALFQQLVSYIVVNNIYKFLFRLLFCHELESFSLQFLRSRIKHISYQTNNTCLLVNCNHYLFLFLEMSSSFSLELRISYISPTLSCDVRCILCILINNYL